MRGGAAVRLVPEYDPRAWLLKALRETAHAMESLIWNVDDGALDRRAEPDEWSCRELAAHMAHMERGYTGWLERMVASDDASIAAFDGDTEDSSDDADDDAFDLTNAFSEQRQQTVYLLWSLDAEDWERRGIHPYLGPLTITQVAREMNEHDLAHLWQLRRLCDRFEAASV
jgi:DinB superfamily